MDFGIWNINVKHITTHENGRAHKEESLFGQTAHILVPPYYRSIVGAGPLSPSLSFIRGTNVEIRKNQVT